MRQNYDFLMIEKIKIQVWQNQLKNVVTIKKYFQTWLKM